MHNIEEKQGYKFTEKFGYIPEDWDVAKIKDKSEVKTGGTPSTSISEYWNGNIKWMSSGELNNKRIYDVVGRITEIGLNNSSANMIPKNSILIGLAGQGKTRGTAAINYVDLSTNQSIAAILPSKYFNSEFLYQCIDKRYEELRELSSGGGGRGGLNKTLIMNLPILLPPLPEQEKIAEVLSDIDELIESTQKLIDKKKDLKTATMQKLLAPKENWENRILGDLGVTYTGLSGKTKQDFETGNAYYITFLNIMNNISVNINTFEKVNIKPTESQCLCKKNDIFFNTSSETPEEVGMCSVLMNEIENLYLNSFCFGFRLRKNNEVDSLFLVYLFRSKFGRELMMRLAQGSTRYNLSKDNFIQSTIKIPKYEEQKKIAHLLFDMDAEIEALEKELNKYKDLKTGMMQELLTGKKRLLNNPNKVELFNVKKMSTPANKKVANDEFKDAIIISMLAYKFGSTQYPLGAFRRQKLSYLFKRHNNLPIDEYLKKAMGPYNPQMKYSGGEGIAIRNKYVKEVKQRGLIASSEIAKAKTYFDKYYSKDSLLWLEQNFRYKSNNELEVLATIDYTILDLKAQNKEITLANIKEYINNNAEWKPKLEKPFFTDSAIIKAIQESKNLLNSH